ncbi:unnamed protein product [Orchesella dallaii]|uniref:C2H2-type domain-containing protein n=1 Tax=Orchesella dallaii TaxID=48710 RepID=A0ABP1PMN5_9HEXA
MSFFIYKSWIALAEDGQNSLIEVDEGNQQIQTLQTSQVSPLNNGNQFPPMQKYLIVPTQHRPPGLGMFLQPTQLGCRPKSKVNNSTCSVIANSRTLYVHGIKIINKFIGSDPDNREYYIKCGACGFILASKQFGGSPTEPEGYLSYETAIIDMNVHVVRNHTVIEPLKRGRPYSHSPILRKRLQMFKKASTTFRKPYFFRNLPSFMCDVCGASVQNLASHKQTHLNRIREVCRYCGGTFATRSSMRRHVRKSCSYSAFNVGSPNSNSWTSPPSSHEAPSPVGDGCSLISEADCSISEVPSTSSSLAPEHNQKQQTDCSEDDLDTLVVENSVGRLICNGVDIYL